MIDHSRSLAKICGEVGDSQEDALESPQDMSAGYLVLGGNIEWKISLFVF